MRRYLISIIIIALISFGIGCGSEKTEEINLNKKNEAVIVPGKGGYIVKAITRDAITLNPLFINDVSSMEISEYIYEGLVRYDDSFELVGVLAESWEILDQGMEIIFHLKKNVKWHDGVLFTSYDVEYTYNTIMQFKEENNENTGVSQLYTFFDHISDFKILDDYSFKVTYKSPYARTLDVWTTPIIPKHIFSKYSTTERLSKAKENRIPVGTGKYRFSKWIPDERIILEANNNYHGKEPFIGKIIFSINPEQSIIYLDTFLEKNDFAYLTSTQFAGLLQNEEKKKIIMPFKYTGAHYMFLGLNLKKDIFKDNKIRRALTYAINRQELIDGVLEGYGKIAFSPFHKHSWANNPEISPLEYNPVTAIELLKEAGWEDTNGDSYIDKDGKTFEFDVAIDRSEPVRNMALKFIKRNLRKIGIKVNIVPLSWTTLINDYLFTGRFDATLIGWDLGNDPDDIYNIWHSKGPLNLISYKNDEVDKLFDKARKTFDKDIRRECYYKIHSLIMEDNPYVFLYVDDILGAVNKRIKGIDVEKNGLNDVSKWYVKYRTVVY